MSVKELIERLETYNSALEVVIWLEDDEIYAEIEDISQFSDNDEYAEDPTDKIVILLKGQF